MKIYVSHSKDFDWQNELYEPLRRSSLNGRHEIVLPHENSTEGHFPSRDFIPKCDLVVAEVSYPGTGIGIELGWADAAKVPIICLHKVGIKPPGSTRVVCKNFIEYKNSQDLLRKLNEEIK